MHRPAALGSLLLALYPLLIFFGLQHLDPRTLGAMVLGVLLLRYRRPLARLFADPPARHYAMIGLPILLGLAVVATNNEVVLLCYPAVMNANMLIVFGATLLRPPTAIERIARLRDPDLPPAAVRYTRNVTRIWCAFFMVNGALAAYTALAASRETWALYNGLIAYVLIGALLGGERIARPWLMRGT